MMSDDSEREQGNVAFRSGDYVTALKHYDRATEDAGDGATAALFANKAAALLKLGRYDHCIQQCLKALVAPGLTPELESMIYLRKGNAYEAQEKFMDAMEAFKNCSLSPSIQQKLKLLRDKVHRESSSSAEDLMQSRAKLITEHNKAVDSYKEMVATCKARPGRIEMVCMQNATSLGFICTADLSDLERVTIDQLRSNEPNVGKLLICRTIAEPVAWQAVRTLIEDHKGEAMQFVLCNVIRSQLEDLNNILPAGTYLAVKEPCLTTDADGKVIQIDNPANLVYLDQAHYLLTNLTWSANVSVGIRASWESLEKRANEFFVAGKYELAIVAYTDAIDLKRKVTPESELAGLLANRAAAYLGDDKPVDAFWDCQSALHVKPTHCKATFRLAKAHAQQADYKQAKEVLVKSPHTTRPEFQTEISRLDRLYREQQHGEYDIKSLLKEAAASKTPRLDHADYSCALRVEWISEEKGYGLFALRDFAPGDLLLVNKALGTTYRCEEAELESNASTRLEAAANNMPEPIYYVCTSRIVKRISKNKDLIKQFYRLYGGQLLERHKYVDEECDAPAVELLSQRVYVIVAQNTLRFCDKNIDVTAEPDFPSFDTSRFGFGFGGCGLWLTASLMRHSCVPNTIIFFVGDLMFVRAAEGIRKGEELTVSYVSSSRVYKERQTSLSQLFGIHCTSALCLCDVKLVADQSHLEEQRKVFLEGFKPRLNEFVSDKAKLIDEAQKLAEEFSSRLAYKNRFDLDLFDLYKGQGIGYQALGQFQKAAKAFETAYFAAVGNGSQAGDTFRYNSLPRDAFYLCYNIANMSRLCRDFRKSAEYLGKMQRAAIVAWGSADKELLQMLAPGLPIMNIPFEVLKYCH